MIIVEEGKCYIFGPHSDGLYSVEQVVRVFDDGIIVSYFRGNAHQQRHTIKEVFAEVGYNTPQHWFKPEELGIKARRYKTFK